ncbi:MAG: glutaredoxin family protein [Candidatus Woesearchaeota archaeon]
MAKRKKTKRQEHGQVGKQEHAQKTKKPKMKKPNTGSMIFLGIFVMIIFYSVFVAMGGRDGQYQADPDIDYDALSECILESDATFYGTEWCQYCTRQKELLGPTFEEHGDEFFVDCDDNNEQCRTAGVTAYPSWKIDGKLMSGLQDLNRLASAMDCTL